MAPHLPLHPVEKSQAKDVVPSFLTPERQAFSMTRGLAVEIILRSEAVGH